MAIDKPLFESDRYWWPVRLMMAVFVWMILSCVSYLYNALSHPAILNDPTLGLGVLVNLVLPVVILLVLARSLKYKIYDTRIETYTLTGRVKHTIMLSDIDSWDELKIRTSFGYLKRLYVFTNDTRYLVAESNKYNNYPAVKQYLTLGKKRNDTNWQAAMRAESPRWYVAIIAISALLFALSIYSWYNHNFAGKPDNSYAKLLAAAATTLLAAFVLYNQSNKDIPRTKDDEA